MLLKDSLSGNTRTCLIVTIADEQESISESQASLRFGITAGHINTKVTTQKVVDVQDETTRIKESIEQVYAELDQMEAKGMHGVLNESHPKVTRDQFVQNYVTLKEQEALLAKANPAQRDNHIKEIKNYKAILIAQLTTGIY